MDWLITISREVAGFPIEISAARVGEDILVLLRGGQRPHIGCTVLAVPRPSLTGDGAISTTTSVLNVTGHKDEILCRRTAEIIGSRLGTVVVCSGGFHINGISEDQIREVSAAVEKMGNEAALALSATGCETES
ncbi:MAG: hypothetical protein LUF32_00045 [Clostridiales bacterium]|nr:hypothetical protein [Clostridiales bacterium]